MSFYALKVHVTTFEQINRLIVCGGLQSHGHKKNQLAIFLFTCFDSYLYAAAQDDEYVDFTDQMTPVCEVEKLEVAPPDGWINVPIQTEETIMRGCQMMLIVEEALIGILRVLSFDLNNPPADMPRWEEHLIGVESVLIHKMGYRLREPIWQRQDVPISGAGFGGAKAIGFSAHIEGNNNPHEAHFLVFENATHKYLISLLTPAQSVDNGILNCPGFTGDFII